MPENRYFTDATLSLHRQITIDGSELHHLSKVMRKKPGEEIELINGKNILAKAKIDQMGKERAIVSIISIEEKKPFFPRIILALAFPKLPKLEWSIEKSVELGANGFWLFPSTLSEKTKVSRNQLERFRLITISAMKQCGRLDLPFMEIYDSLFHIPFFMASHLALFGDLSKEALPFTQAFSSEINETLILFIGSAKGWDEKERNYLKEKWQAKSVKLNPYILRAETATIAALSIAANRLWNSPT